MSETEPMTRERREQHYQRQHKGQFTRRQVRRLDHKQAAYDRRAREAVAPLAGKTWRGIWRKR